MRPARSLRGFAGGVVVGTLFGSAALAVAAFGLKGWQAFSNDFKQGYVTGYLDMALIARNLDPGGYVDTRYPFVPQAKPREWCELIDELYKDPANQEYPMTSMLQLASKKLQDKYGLAVTPEERTRARQQMQMQAIQKKREAAAAKAGIATGAGAETKPAPAPAVPAPNKPAPLPDSMKPARKWCRCDGTDPKKAREARQAAAAREDEDEDAAPASGVKASGTPAPQPTHVEVSPPIVTKMPSPSKAAAPAGAPPANATTPPAK